MTAMEIDPGAPPGASHPALETEPQVPDSIAEATPFEPLRALDTYALASIEMMNLGKMAKTLQEKPQVDHFRQECISRIEERITALNGVIESVHQNVLFVSFRREPTVTDSALRLIGELLNLLQEKFHYQGTDLKLRIGVDMAHTSVHNPITSTTERSVAMPGHIVVSEDIRTLIESGFSTESIGPLRIGNRMVTFYQVVRPQAPHQPVQQAHPPQEAYAPEETLPVQPVHPASHQPPPDLPAADSRPMATAPEQVSSPYVSPAHEAPEEPEAYSLPVFGGYQALRAPNFTYEKVFEALGSEILAFIEEGTKAKGRVLSVSANEGLGKSHILDMLHAQLVQSPLADKVYWMVARNYHCFGEEQLPLYLWMDWLQTAMGMGMETNPIEEGRASIGKTFSLMYEAEPPPDVLAFFEDMLSITPLSPLTLHSRENLGRGEHYLGNVLRMLAHQKPVVMVLEDIHHADIASLDLLVRLMKGGLLEHPVYLVLTHPRHFYPDGELAQALQSLPYKEFVISNLNDQESRFFLKEGPLYGTFDAFPTPLIEQIVAKSQGLPVYMVEVLKALQLQGILELQQVPVGNSYVEKLAVGAQHVQAAQEMLLPESVEDLLRHRYQYLSEPARYILKNAAVLGEKFTFAVLQDVCGPMEEGQFQQFVKELFDHGWLQPDMVNTGRFCHSVYWQVAYELIEPDARIQHHRLLSEYLQEAANSRFAVNPSQIAYHAEKGQLINRAIHAWNLTGVYSTQVGSVIGANVAMFRALELLAHTESTGEHTNPEHVNPENVNMALLIRENLGMLNLEENPDLSVQLLGSVAHYYESIGNTPKLIEILGFMASAYEASGEFYNALEKMERAVSLISKDQYPQEYVTMVSNQLEYLFCLGKIQRALEHLEHEIEPICARHPLDRNSVYFNAFINSRLVKAQIYLMQCNNAAFNVIDEALGFTQEKDLAGLSLSLKLARAQGFLLKGNYGGCDRSLQGILSEVETLPNSEAYLARWGLVAIAYHCEMGDWQNASLLIPNTMYQAEKARDYVTWMLANTYAGYIAMGMGNLQDAKNALENAIVLSSDYRFATSALMGWRFLAETELLIGAREVAETIAERAIDIAQKPEFNHRYEYFMLTNIRAQCLLHLEDTHQAGQLLEGIWPQVIQTGFSPLIAHTAFRIGLLYHTMQARAANPETAHKHQNRAEEFLNKAREIWRQLGNPYQLQLIENAVR